MTDDQHLPPSIRTRLALDVDLTVQGHDNILIGRLLEEGNREDLRWLFAELGREAISRWFETQGGRALSARSRALWEVVLGTSAPENALAKKLWPLA